MSSSKEKCRQRKEKHPGFEPWVPPTFGIWAKEEEKPPVRWKGNQGFVGSMKAKRRESIEKEGVANCMECPLTCNVLTWGQCLLYLSLVTLTPHHMYTHTVILTKLPMLKNLKCHPQVCPSGRPPHLQYLVSQLLGSQCWGHLGSGQKQRTHADRSWNPFPYSQWFTGWMCDPSRVQQSTHAIQHMGIRGKTVFSFFWIISYKGYGLDDLSCHMARPLGQYLKKNWLMQIWNDFSGEIHFLLLLDAVRFLSFTFKRVFMSTKVLLCRESWRPEVLKHLKIVVCTLPQLCIILKAEATYVQGCSTQQWPIRNKICVFPFL